MGRPGAWIEDAFYMKVVGTSQDVSYLLMV